MKLVIIIILGAIISWVGYSFLIPMPPDGNRFSVLGEFTAIRAIFLYVVMLVGIFARGLHDHIQKRVRNVKLAKSLSAVSKSNTFLMAVLVSPIVFFGVYNATKDLPDTVVAILLAFQNGFFWHVVFEKSKNEVV